MESAIYLTSTLKDVENSVINDLYLCRDYHIQPSEIRRLPYWQYEIMLEKVHEINKKAEEDEKKREKNGGLPEGYSIPKPSPMPSMPQINIPKF